MKAGVLLALQVGAFWPTWRWYIARLQDGSDEPWGIVALVTIIVLIGIGRSARKDGARASVPADQFDLSKRAKMPAFHSGGGARVPSLCQFFGAALGISIYVILYPHLPPLFRAVIAICALAPLASSAIGSRTIHLPLLGLGLLSLPLIASLQFYLGFPVRVLTALLAAKIITLTGFPVIADGTNLLWAGETVVVDAPCAGIRMLWTGLYLCFTLAWMRRLSFARTWIAYTGSTVTIFFGNVVRNVLLFYIEAKIIQPPLDLHAPIGVACFALVAAAIHFIVRGNRAQKTGNRYPLSVDRPPLTDHRLPLTGSRLRSAASGSLIALCLVAVAAPIFTPPERTSPSPKNFPGWPTQFQGREIVPTALSSREIEQLTGFPGRVGRFTDGERELIIRWVTAPTRALHPAADCLRGAGFSTRPLPLQVDSREHRWGCVEAIRGPDRLTVCERIFDGEENSFSDVSSWFWNAVLERTRGPWWSVAVMERRT